MATTRRSATKRTIEYPTPDGNKRKHIAPDVFVVRGVPKLPPRKYYLPWGPYGGQTRTCIVNLTASVCGDSLRGSTMETQR